MPHTLTIKQKKGKPGQVYYPLQLNAVPKPSAGPRELLIRIQAAALNHRDVFIRQHLYPDISFKAPLFSDACGTVVDTGTGCVRAAELLNKLVVLTPFRGWDANLGGPEDWSKFSTIGGTGPRTHLGGAQTYVVVDESEVELCPEHLSAVEGAALPSCGVTAWRAVTTKSGPAQPGCNMLITGIGGGVALQSLQFALALGYNVYVTSGSEAKLLKAQLLGAKGGVLYTNDEWPKELAKLLPAEQPYLDAVIDGAGGDIIVRTIPLLKPGGVISCYGMTVAPVMDWPMQAVMKNIELRGTTLGSRIEFRDMVDFVRKHGIRPVISRSVKGLDCVDAIDGLFEEMRAGKQYGKLVVEI
jgi:NADPH:quinone reductase-like Zn-dependent oxidoreductase